jgi:putative flippase GtrA
MRDGSISTRLPAPRTVPDRATRIMLARFLVVAGMGAAGTAGHYAFLFAAVATGMMEPVAATVVGALVGALVNFVLNTKVTFRGRLPAGAAARFFTTAALAAAANGVMMAALLTVFPIAYLPAQLLVTASLLCATFGIHATWTFRAAAAR